MPHSHSGGHANQAPVVKLAFLNVPCTQTCLHFLLGNKYVFVSTFGGKGAVPGTVPLHTLGSTTQQEPCNTNMPSGLVPGTLLWTYCWAFLGHRGGERDGDWYGTSAKPEGHFTKGMFGKP